MPQFQAKVPGPLCHHLPALLSPGRATAPSIWIDLLVFIRERWLKGTTVQGQLDDIAGREGVLRQVREEEFVGHPGACHPNGTLLFACRMRSHDHAAGRSLRSDWDLGAIVEAANHLAFGTLLDLIKWQVQPCRNLWMIEQVVVFVASHKHEPGQVSQHGSVPILAGKRAAARVLAEADAP